jgi:cytochrome P450
MRQLTLRIVGKALFDVDFDAGGAVTPSAIRSMIRRIDRDRMPFYRLLGAIPTAERLREWRELPRVDTEVYRLLDQEPAGNGLLGVLASQFGRVEARDEIVGLLFAGNVTLTNVLSWVWVLLAQHPDIESRLHAEIDCVLGDRSPEASILDELKFTRMVFAEALRLYPPVWLMSRRATEDCEIGGYRIARGSLVMVSPYLLHRDARFFPDPDRFDPMRWADEPLPPRHPRPAYFPFSIEPRGCIGEPFAWMEGALVIATLAQRWRLEVVRPARVRGIPNELFAPGPNLQVKARARASV